MDPDQMLAVCRHNSSIGLSIPTLRIKFTMLRRTPICVLPPHSRHSSHLLGRTQQVTCSEGEEKASAQEGVQARLWSMLTGWVLRPMEVELAAN